MTTTDRGSSPSRPASPVPRAAATRTIPFRRLLDVELRKTVDTRAAAALLVGVAAVVSLVVLALTVWGRDDELGLAYLATSVAFPVQLVLPMVTALAVTGEWSQRSALTTFALVPRRGRVIAAKAAAGLLVALGAALLTFALGTVGAFAGAVARGIDPVWDLTLATAGRLTLLDVLAAAVGFAFGVAIRTSTPTLVAYLGFLLIAPILSGMFSALFDWYATLGPWVDLSSTMQVLGAPVVTGEQWAQLGTSTLVWVGLPLVVGLRHLLRVEIR